MKICPNCHAENQDDANFCENCGFPLADVAVQGAPEQKSYQAETFSQNTGEQPNSSYNNFDNNNGNYENLPPRQPQRKSPLPIILGILAALAVVVVGGFTAFFMYANHNAGKGNDNNTSASSTSVMESTTSSNNSSDISKYDQLMAEAKQLTIDGKYKESEKKLATIPVSDLNKPEFAALKEAVDELSDRNEDGLEAEANKKANDRDDDDDDDDVVFTGKNAKWATNYVFYYQQSSQKQQSLRIEADGDVVQHSENATYEGEATITSASGKKLSYDTNNAAPTSMPKTKEINADVLITIDWDDNGGTQYLYGYLSYSGRYVLTDGKSKGAGVNEVWISN